MNLDGVASFDLKFTEAVEGATVRVNCEDDGSFKKAAMSDEFSIHAFPKTGLLQETDTGFTYKGSAEYVSTVLEAFENLLKVGQQKTGIRVATDGKPAAESERVFITAEHIAMWPEF